VKTSRQSPSRERRSTRSNTKKWSLASEAAVDSLALSPVGKVLYVAVYQYPLYAIDAATAAKKWSSTIGDHRSFSMRSTLTPDGSTIFFGGTDKAQKVKGLYALWA
jgi:outer membrane protein assembly factor BamB